VLDVRGNSGGYDPNILPTFLRGQWSCGDYYIVSRDGKARSRRRLQALPVALLVNSGTASRGEGLALKFRAHKIGPIVGEETAGMASGGARRAPAPDGSMLWFTAAPWRDSTAARYEGQACVPDVAADGDAIRRGSSTGAKSVPAVAVTAVSSQRRWIGGIRRRFCACARREGRDGLRWPGHARHDRHEAGAAAKVGA
jgi:C-terminal processing protease CtpA/Prc